jgi:cysteine desulfurase
MTPLDLDHNAGSPLRPAAAAALRACEGVGNPASAHAAGRAARRLLEDARERVAGLLGAFPDEVVFTSGATEANNLAAFGLAGDPPGRLLLSAIEHPCVTEPFRQLERRGFALDWLPADAVGRVPAEAVRERLTADTRLVALMLANHETGAVQPVREVAAFAPVLSDAAQAVGKLPVDFHALGVRVLAASAHKFGGPVGAGLLLLRRGVAFAPQWFGGHQQGGRRPGTEPVALAAGLAAALGEAVEQMDATRAAWTRQRRMLVDRLSAAVPPVVVNGPPDEPGVLPNTVNLSFPGCRTDLLLMALDLAGVRASGGSACSSGSLLPSPVLAAMGVPDDVLRSAVRFSLGPATTDAGVEDAAGRIAGCVRRVRGTKATSPPGPLSEAERGSRSR